MQGKKAVIALAVIAVALGAGGYLFQWLSPELNKEVPVPEILSDNKNMNTLKLTSLAFKNGGFIPSKYTCDELNISPPLQISGVPKGVKSLALIMDDPDVPKQLRPDGVFDHWAVYGISPETTFIDEGATFGALGVNGAGTAKYTGPCPPVEYQPTTHRYFFKLYALDIGTLNFIKAPTKKELQTAMEGHILAQAELVGLYDRAKTIRENN